MLDWRPPQYFVVGVILLAEMGVGQPANDAFSGYSLSIDVDETKPVIVPGWGPWKCEPEFQGKTVCRRAVEFGIFEVECPGNSRSNCKIRK
jgi:hypothetical protein